MIINHNLNNLSGGVSKQPDEARFDNQVEEMINFLPTVSNGLVKRNALRKLFKPTGTLYDDMPVHFYDRGDGMEKYGMYIQGNKLKVFDTDGNQKTVNTFAETGNPISDWNTEFGILKKKDIGFLTVGDTTWILNKKKITAMTNEKTKDNVGNYAFYWVSRAFDNGQGLGYTYQVVLNGTVYSQNSTSTASAISGLAVQIASAGYTVKYINSIMRISRATPFTFASGDSWGNQASVGWVSTMTKISDLPNDMKGFTEDDVGIIEITGTDRDTFSAYYLKWTGEYWSETAKGGIDNTIDATTMPCKLVRNSDGTFTIGYNIDSNERVPNFKTSWDKRRKGNDDSNPIPSFIGYPITTMFFFKNRLGFTSEENVILSETGSYYNFFATTAMEILDSDPIDASVDSDTVSIIRNVNAVAGSLTLWADNAQFLLSGGEILSPATTRISKTSSYNCDNTINPVLLDNEIMFFRRVGDRTDVFSYSPSSLNTDKSTAEELTSHCKGYVPSSINDAVVSSANNLVFFLDAESRKKLYVYRYHIHNNERVLTSWFEWRFDTTINTMEVLAGVLYLFVNGDTICSIDLSERFTSGVYLDYNPATDIEELNYTALVTLSKFNIETKQGTRVIREPFYVKNVKIKKDGYVDLVVSNNERISESTILSQYLNRKIFIGGNSEKVYIKFVSSYNTGCVINAISIEGLLKIRSRNI